MEHGMGGFREPCVVIGSKGMLGIDLVDLLVKDGVSTVPLAREDIDIRDPESVLRAFKRYRPGTVINVAAITDVDGCESKVEEAFRVNAEGPCNLGLAASAVGTVLVHMSTDYVFDGAGAVPYKEEDAIAPIGVYGASKAEGEKHVRETLPEMHCIVRTQWLFGVHGKNFVEAIINAAQTRDALRVVHDQRGRPSYAPDVARALVDLCRLGARGTVHVAGSGETSWYEFARAILDRAGLDRVRVEPITTRELGRPAPRPAYSVLDTSRFTTIAGYALRHWREALDEYFSVRGRMFNGLDQNPACPHRR
jgi:dTDP-4-dehydrorhamnose reductase